MQGFQANTTNVRLRDSKGHFIAPQNRAARRQLAKLVSAAYKEALRKEWDAHGAQFVRLPDEYSLELVRRWHIRQAELKARKARERGKNYPR